MAQHPAARRILLLGGNLVEDVPELLRYPVERVVQVDLDPGIRRLLAEEAGEAGPRPAEDPRLTVVHADAAAYVQTADARFDVILIRTPEPLTAGLNRFYTREFYEAVRRRLAPGGFSCTWLEASERLTPEAARVAASVYRTLQAAFPVVRVTAGSPYGFFMSGSDGPLTFDRPTLYERSRGVALHGTQFFRPEYLLDADELDPVKTAAVAAHLRDTPAPLNTLAHPVTYYLNLTLWSRFSGSRVEPLLRRLERWPAGGVAGVLFLAVAGVAVYAWRRRAVRRPDAPDATARGARLLAGLIMGVAGAAGVALEIVMLYALQSLSGYVYTRMGLMVGLFMLGSVAGGTLGRWAEGHGARRAVRLLLGMLTILLLATAAVPAVLAGGGGSGAPVWGERLLFALMTAVGFAVGGSFAACGAVLRACGSAPGPASALADAADYGGSAAGGLVVGVLAIPVFGLAATAGIIAAALAGGMIAVVLLWVTLAQVGTGVCMPAVRSPRAT
jgi:spermidine synthase